MNRMKKIFVMMSLALLSQALDGQSKVIYSHSAGAPVAIDGQELETDWLTADSVVFDGRSCLSEDVAVVKTLWDNEFLYLLFKVSDANLQSVQTEKDHRQLFLDDMAEFLIDATHDRDSCWNESKIIYHINLLGAKKDDRGTAQCYSDFHWDGDAVYAIALFGTLNDSSDRDAGYQVEVAVPWSELGLSPADGVTIGVNFAIGDSNNQGRQLFDWVQAPNFRSPHLFGDLILRK
jgi:hypothetical protein